MSCLDFFFFFFDNCTPFKVNKHIKPSFHIFSGRLQFTGALYTAARWIIMYNLTNNKYI